MAHEASQKRLRASSNELESILLLGQLDPVAAADRTGTNSTAATQNGGFVSSSRCVRLTATKHKRGGYASAGKSSHQRTAQEYTSKEPGWEHKLAKCKNALARSVVQNTFTKHTPSGWKGKRFHQENIVPQKGVITDQEP